MKWLLLIVALGIQAQMPREGPYAHQAGHRCWRHNDQVFQGITFHKCDCKLHCDTNGNPVEDYDCVTSCNAREQCVCHTDEPCESHR
jgi:hypothetical protein